MSLLLKMGKIIASLVCSVRFCLYKLHHVTSLNHAWLRGTAANTHRSRSRTHTHPAKYPTGPGFHWMRVRSGSRNQSTRNTCPHADMLHNNRFTSIISIISVLRSWEAQIESDAEIRLIAQPYRESSRISTLESTTALSASLSTLQLTI